MLLVKNIELQEVSDDIVEIFKNNNPKFHSWKDIKEELVKVETEIVQGRRFINERNEEICLGLTKNVEETIGLYQKSFEALQRDNERLRNKLNKLYIIKGDLEYKYDVLYLLMNKFSNMSFLQALKWVFTRSKIK